MSREDNLTLHRSCQVSFQSLILIRKNDPYSSNQTFWPVQNGILENEAGSICVRHDHMINLSTIC